MLILCYNSYDDPVIFQGVRSDLPDDGPDAPKTPIISLEESLADAEVSMLRDLEDAFTLLAQKAKKMRLIDSIGGFSDDETLEDRIRKACGAGLSPGEAILVCDCCESYVYNIRGIMRKESGQPPLKPWALSRKRAK